MCTACYALALEPAVPTHDLQCILSVISPVLPGRGSTLLTTPSMAMYEEFVPLPLSTGTYDRSGASLQPHVLGNLISTHLEHFCGVRASSI